MSLRSLSAVSVLAAGLALAAGLGAGCTGELTFVDPAGGGGGPDASGGGDGGGAAARAKFDADIDPLFTVVRPKGACATCHNNANTVDGPDFLGPSTDTHYATLTANTLYIAATPETSLLYTKGDHPTGNAFCEGAGVPYAECTANEKALLAEWIALEAAAQ